MTGQAGLCLTNNRCGNPIPEPTGTRRALDLNKIEDSPSLENFQTEGILDNPPERKPVQHSTPRQASV